MTRNPTNLTVKKKTSLHFCPLKFQFHDSRGRQRREERLAMTAQQQGAKPSNDMVDFEIDSTLPESPFNAPTNSIRGKRRCYGIQSVAERKERRRATRAGEKQNVKSDLSHGKESAAPVKNQCRVESDDGVEDGVFSLKENCAQDDVTSSPQHSERLARASDVSTGDSASQTENNDDEDHDDDYDDCSPVKNRRLFSAAKKRRFILEDDSTDDEEMDTCSEKNVQELEFDQDEVKTSKLRKGGKERHNNAKLLRCGMRFTDSKHDIPINNSAANQSRKISSDNITPARRKMITSEKKQTKDEQNKKSKKATSVQKQHARIIGKSVAAKSPFAQEMYAKAAAATLTNDKKGNHSLVKKIARSQKTMVTATERSSKRQKVSPNFNVIEGIAVDSGSEETGEETSDSDDQVSEYQPTQGEPDVNSICEVTKRHHSTLVDSAKKTESSHFKIRVTRNCGRKKTDSQNAGRGRDDDVVNNVRTAPKQKVRKENSKKSVSPCPKELKKLTIDYLQIPDDKSIHSNNPNQLKGGPFQMLDEQWGPADIDALFDEESNNDDVEDSKMKLTRNVHTVYTQREDFECRSYNTTSVEENGTVDKQNVKQNPTCANEAAGAESKAKTMSFVQFNTRYISTSHKRIILAEIQKDDDSEPSTPSQSSESNSKIPLSAVSLSNEKPTFPSSFVQEASAIDAVSPSDMVKLTKKIKDMNEVVKQLGVMMQEINYLASSAE